MTNDAGLRRSSPIPHPFYAQVLVERRISGSVPTLTYEVPDALADRITRGAHVVIPLGTGQTTGRVVSIGPLPDGQEPEKIRGILAVLDQSPPVPAECFELAEWISREYFCSPAEALRAMLPEGSEARLERVYRATEASTPLQPLLFEAPEPVPDTVALLRTAAEPLSLAQIRGRLGRPLAEWELQRLRQKGLIEAAWRLRPPRARPKTRLQVLLAVPPEEAEERERGLADRRGAQKRILRALLEARQPVLLSHFARSRKSIEALQAVGLITVAPLQVRRRPVGAEMPVPPAPHALTSQQKVALDAILGALAGGSYHPVLLHGVTGSGKTEVYLRSAQAAVTSGGTVLILVPEIALTPRAVALFRERFGETVAVLHSALSPGERYDEWDRIRRGAARVVVGARSAVLAPLSDIRLLVVDEAHDSSYKQEAVPHYDARRVAEWRARRGGAVMVLGSATPSIEQYWSAVGAQGLAPLHLPSTPAASGELPAASPPSATADGGEVRSPLRSPEVECGGAALGGPPQLLVLPERIGGAHLPEVEIVDLRQEKKEFKTRLLSQRLLEALEETLACRRQAILFINRRGYAPFVFCWQCGQSLRCADCAVSLIFHKVDGTVRCHHCDFRAEAPATCQVCGSAFLSFSGTGTERSAEAIQDLLPQARISRMDKETVSRRGAHARILSAFARGEADILLGTQMVTKGHDFPRVTLVGILSADTGLNFPDFRAPEFTFQILSQVSGRAGRGEDPGRVIVQTFQPHHHAIRAAAAHDFLGFYEGEVVHREERGYPPFSRLARVIASGEGLEAVRKAAEAFAARARAAAPLIDGEARVVGPSPAPLHRLRGKYRWHVEIFSPEDTLVPIVRQALEGIPRSERAALAVDVDPVSLM